MRHFDIGNGTFFHADCFDVLSQIPDGWVDMILCDLPYGTTACAWDSILPFDKLWEQYWRVCKPNGAVVLTGSQPFTTTLIASQLKAYKAVWYWQKERGTNFVQAKRYPMKIVEECVVFCRNTPVYNPIMRKVKPYKHVLPKPKNGQAQHMDSLSVNADGSRTIKDYDSAYPTNVLDMPRDNMSRGKSLHPTQKPVALFEYLIRTYTNDGAVVLDNCAGSGTTAIAAENANRRWLCIEKDDIYAVKAMDRIYAHTQRNVAVAAE